MPDRPRLTFATRDLQADPRAGSPIRTLGLVMGLAQRFDLGVITFEHEEGSTHGRTDVDALRATLPGIELVVVPGEPASKRARQLLSLARPRSFEWGRYVTTEFRDALRADLRRRSPALVHFDDIGVGLSGPVAGPLNALAPHNVEHRVNAATAASAGGLRAAYSRVEAAKIKREETRLWRAMDVCVAVSELDAKAMLAGGARDVLVVPNGTAPADPLPPPRREAGEPLRLLFVGTGTYWPNEHGLRWMVSEVLPRLRGQLDVVLEVVGLPPAAPPEASEVTYTGSVPSVRPHYERSHVVVVPLHHGSGTRLKVVEAMAQGRPVVSTAVGAEGLPVRGGEDFLLADTPEAFAAALRDVARWLDRPQDGLASMLARARTAAEGLQWPGIAARLAADYEALLEARS